MIYEITFKKQGITRIETLPAKNILDAIFEFYKNFGLIISLLNSFVLCSND